MGVSCSLPPVGLLCSRAESHRLDHGSQSRQCQHPPEGPLVGPLVALPGRSPRPQSFWFSRPGVGTEAVYFSQVPR